MKWTGFGVLGLLLLVTLGYGIGFVINLHDAPLSAQARAFAQRAANPYPDQENIYVAFAGFAAPAGMSVWEAARPRIDRQRRSAQLSYGDIAGMQQILHEDDGQRLDFSGNIRFIDPNRGSVWSDAQVHRTEIDSLIAANAELYARYRALWSLGGYYEIYQSAFGVTPFYISGHIHRLFLAKAALDLREPAARAAALRDLNADLELWHRVLVGDGEIITKMIALAWVHGDLLLIADALADPSGPIDPNDPEVQRLVRLDAPQAFSLGSAFASEYRLSARMYAEMAADVAAGRQPMEDAQPAWRRTVDAAAQRLWAPFFKLNDSLNRLAAGEARMAALSEPQPANFEALKRWQEGSLPESLSGSWYNPIGKQLVGISLAGWVDYVPRTWDAAALQRAVRCAFEIRRAGLQPEGVPAFLAKHPELSRHPVSGKPFAWDPAARRLSVPTLARHADYRPWLPVWTGARELAH
ncbi:MAG: hypothetical protein JOZ67_12035 [Gammaproteobacteria bacterium]|nr:hypothetical protein [Gammaproteobacteria bacterium]